MFRINGALITRTFLMALIAVSAATTVTTQGGGTGPVRPVIDTDGDGVADRSDACPSTPPGAQVVAEGCSALDLVTNPGAVLGAAVTQVAAASAALDVRRFQELADVERLLSNVHAEFAAASDLLGEGEMCQASAAVRRGLNEMERAQARFSGFVPPLQKRVLEEAARAPGVEYGDAGQFEIRWHELAAGESVIKRAMPKLEATVRAVDGACAMVAGPLDIRGAVTKTDDALGRVRFDNGMVVGLTAASTVEATEGAQLAVKGIAFTDGTGVATSLEEGPLWQPGVFTLCMALRVAPLQAAFAPVSQSNVTLHSTLGYLQDGYLQLEEGTKLSVAQDCSPSSSTPGWLWRYSMKIAATYQAKASGSTLQKTLGTDVTAGEVVSFPANVALLTPMTLTTTIRRQHCHAFTNQCGAIELMAGPTYQAFLFARHGFCSASGAGAVTLDDDPATKDFRPHRLSILKTSLVPQSAVFEAQGYAITNGVSSRPQVVPIGLNQDYAVYDDDFLDPDDLYSEEMTGVEVRAALRWPRIKGTRHGQPYWYTCDVQPIVRDAVEVCPQKPHSLYKLPWVGYAKTTQGNNNPFTHTGAGAFAFDFGMNMFEPIYATRGGTVKYVREDLSKTSDPYLVKAGLIPAAPANALKIKHQDGTYSWYLHMAPYSVFPEVDDVVKRGDVLALVGMTGNATGPHLHYQVNPTEGDQSHQIRFQAWIPPATPAPCHIPVEGQTLLSTQ